MTIPAHNAFGKMGSSMNGPIELSLPSSNRSSRAASPSRSLGQLTPEIYRNPEGGSSEKKAPLGKLYFSLEYCFQRNQLKVFIERASGLLNKDPSCSLDPQAEVSLIPSTEGEKKTRNATKVQKKTANPIFDEFFVFPVRYHDLADKVLLINIFNFQETKKPLLIGHFILRDIELYNLSVISTFCERLSPPSNESEGNKGKLSISLCYMPGAKRMSVTIHKAIQLKAMDISGSSDPYVKVWQMINSKRHRKRKTQVMKRTTFPVFNESFIFEVDCVTIEKMAFIVTVVDYDKYKQNDLIGSLELSKADINRSCVNHWNECIQNPSKQIYRWHNLR